MAINLIGFDTICFLLFLKFWLLPRSLSTFVACFPIWFFEVHSSFRLMDSAIDVKGFKVYLRASWTLMPLVVNIRKNPFCQMLFMMFFYIVCSSFSNSWCFLSKFQFGNLFAFDVVGNNNFDNTIFLIFLESCLLSWTFWYLFCLLLESVLQVGWYCCLQLLQFFELYFRTGAAMFFFSWLKFVHDLYLWLLFSNIDLFSNIGL